MALTRIKKEYQLILRANDGIKVKQVDPENPYEWITEFDGPEDSPQEGEKFHVSVTFPNDYPFKPPRMRFLTKVYHPSINERGKAYLDITGNNWSPALTIHAVLRSYKSLLSNPNLDCYFAPQNARLYETEQDKYYQIARQFTRAYAF